MRDFAFRPLTELKFDDGGSALGTFSGYGAVFGNEDSYGDVIAKGAFKSSLREWKKNRGKFPPMLLQHGGGMFGGSAQDMTPIGKWTGMAEDDVGLKVEGELLEVETDIGKRIYRALKTGVLDGLSIGYRTKTATVGTKPDEPIRTLKEIDLFEVSLVTMPANDKARVQTVKAVPSFTTLSDFERCLRDAGWSKSDARAYVSRFKAVVLSGSESRPGGGNEWSGLDMLGFDRLATAMKGSTK